jgi:6-phosphogluconate dehydrogenase
LTGPDTRIEAPGFVDDIEQALYASKIVSYAQGFMQMRAASEENGWNLDLSRIAKLWRAGCIIRARFLDDIADAFSRKPENLMVDAFFAEALTRAQGSWRTVVSAAVTAGIPVPAYATALSFYDSFRRADLPANPSRHSATTSEPTPTSAGTAPGASTSTPSGWRAAPRRPPDLRRGTAASRRR